MAIENWRTNLDWPEDIGYEPIEYLYEKDGETKSSFSDENALAVLLLDETVFLNSHWWRKDLPEKVRKLTSLNVSCNDVFVWGSADAEEMVHDDIEPLYRMWVKDRRWAGAIWCMIKRREMPQKPVEKKIREEGIWDLDALKLEHGLRPNLYDNVGRITSKIKYAAYCAWVKARGNTPLPYDSKWWDGWKEFISNNPNWRDEEWRKAEAEAIKAFQVESGYIKESE